MLKGLKQLNVPEMEERVLRFWKDRGIFSQSLLRRKGKKQFVFYEGPPTANGKPGIHHVLTRAFKDIILRYKTMRGFYVPRRAGWDTHGLPVEIAVEKELGLNSKKDIEKFGIAAFNKKCRESVWKFKDEWERLTDRMGFWLDFNDAYITYANEYVERVWGVLAHVALRQVQGKSLLYKGHRIVPWCTRCGTGLSSHELAQPGGYKEVTDTTAYVKFKASFAKASEGLKKISKGSNVYFLAWTTTPWTLPGNVALAVGKDIEYGIFSRGKDHFIVANERKSVLGEGFESAGSILGNKLVGTQYRPLFDVPSLKNPKSHRVYAGDFVTTTEGTGVVHIAPMYGEDDYALGTREKLPQVHTVDAMGKFIADVAPLRGMYAKGKETEKTILEFLEKEGGLFKTESYTHEYPHCWRCGTALLYYARHSWYIGMSTLRSALTKENKSIHWIPSHIKEGRFGEWLHEAKDWAISRERYWGTPLPVWQHVERAGRDAKLRTHANTAKKEKKELHCENVLVVKDLADLDRYAPKKNKFITVRHTEADHILTDKIAAGEETKNNASKLTEKGVRDAKRIAARLVKEKIDVIYTSPYHRTTQMASIIGEATGARIIEDARFAELNQGTFNNGGSVKAYRKFFKNIVEEFSKKVPGGESLNEAKARMVAAVRDINNTHEGKTIVIIGHGHPLWALFGGLEGLSDEACAKVPYPVPGDVREVMLHNWPYDEHLRLDVHRPYIDAVQLRCPKCKELMERVPEVADVWLDSGCMPFAATADQREFYADERGLKSVLRSSALSRRESALGGYPADFITEGIDQTRGWFYTLLATAVLMKKRAPYKNVISLGLIHDKFGQKMSKSKGNVVDPWEMIKKYGIDAVRWYFYTVNPPGEPKLFDEKDVAHVVRQFLMILFNSYVFYDTYADPVKAQSAHGAGALSAKNHVLDRWIVAKLHALMREVTKKLDAYEVGDAARAITSFVDDLSRWYIRRSRRRFQRPHDLKDHHAASATLYYVLLEISKLIAPFAPFFGEALYGALTTDYRLRTTAKKIQSVHLEDWPTFAKATVGKSTIDKATVGKPTIDKATAGKPTIDKATAGKSTIDKATAGEGQDLIKNMDEVRRIASLALAERAKIGIKVRQPLAQLKTNNVKLKTEKELLEVLAEEVNVKRVVVDPKITNEIEFDTTITQELREEGMLREFGRMIQGLRQEAGYEPKHTICAWIYAPAFEALLSHHLTDLKSDVGAEAVEFQKTEKFDAELATKLDGNDVWIGIKRA